MSARHQVEDGASFNADMDLRDGVRYWAVEKGNVARRAKA